MNLVQIDPPGTWCINSAFVEMISPISAIESFIEIGPGEGKMSEYLCSRGLTGIGVDFSREMIEKLSQTMDKHIRTGHYSITKADVMAEELDIQADLVFSIMVLEHIEHDTEFLNRMKGLVKPGGRLLICVPARMDKWNIEDELFGHYRRYSRNGLSELFSGLGLTDTRVWSVTAPVANLLFAFSNLAIKRSHVVDRKDLSLLEQTKLSGYKDIFGKTLFPSWVKLLCNKVTMRPLAFLQKLFYHTDFGLSVMACGTVQRVEGNVLNRRIGDGHRTRSVAQMS